MAIWGMSRGHRHRPQGVEHYQGHPLEALGLIFSKVVGTKLVEDNNNQWFELVSRGHDHLGHVQRP